MSTKKQVTDEIRHVRATLQKLTAALSEADKGKVDLTCVLESVSMADGELLVALRDLQAAARPKRKRATTKPKASKPTTTRRAKPKASKRKK